MSELTLTLIRLGLLLLLWLLVFSIVGVLRSDLYGTRVSRRSQRQSNRAGRAAPVAQGGSAPQGSPAGRPPGQDGRAPVSSRSARRVPTTLTVTQGSLAGSSLPLSQAGVLIGRNPDCTLVLEDDFASGRHARIFPRPEGWFLEDLGSTNGTFLGNSKLTRTEQVGVGSVLRIGRTVLELRG